MAEPALLTFDLVVATVDRTDELGALLGSLERQSHGAFRVLVVDQNEDDRLASVLECHPALDVVRVRSSRGLSRARNAALPQLTADAVGFPDDDCIYPAVLLERIARLLAARPQLDGVTGRLVDASGAVSSSWEQAGAVLTEGNLWNRAASGTTFLRRRVVERVGLFDERLGLGAPTHWPSGEEIDYLVRAVRTGARIEYDPELTVIHEEQPAGSDVMTAIGARDGGSVGYILRKHRYPPATVARMLVRPAGGAFLSLAQGDRARARFHAATLRGRIAGYRGA
jgi:glycosyltransferase involved in cell wall biosynthesis